MKRDDLFRETEFEVGSFHFGGEVAAVFDDMLGRSVPFYGEIQRMIAEMAPDFARTGTAIYDLGCSTGTTLLHLNRALGDGVSYRGVDYSDAMLAKCRENLAAGGFSGDLDLVHADLNEGVAIENASMVLMVLSLQFVRPGRRRPLLDAVRAGLNDGGCLVLVEKVVGEVAPFDRLFTGYYHEMKRRNGYSEMEISKKREALENVLIPRRASAHRDLLLGAGFTACDVFFKWYNFCGLLAVK